MNEHNIFRTFTAAKGFYRTAFRSEAIEVRGATWQGKDVSDKPDMITHELPFQSFKVDLGNVFNGCANFAAARSALAEDVKPNLPWAEAHFEERVCGQPINPGVEWANWPWNTSAESFREEAKFNHNYMERLWPKQAGFVKEPTFTADGHVQAMKEYGGAFNSGIYHPYGDLKSLVAQLAHDPLTRQAVIPLYFPEDTGAPDRKPCTLLYQFMVRNGRLHMYYPLRSCDFIRHWSDDCYMAVRLLIWVLRECTLINPAYWSDIRPGEYHMHMTSFHIFKNDLRSL